MKIWIYNEPRTPNFTSEQIISYLHEWLPWAQVRLRPDFLSHWLKDKSSVGGVAQKMANCKIRNPAGRQPQFSPLAGEVNFERRRIIDSSMIAFGHLYDAPKLLGVFSDLVPKEEWPDLHIVFTNQLIGTFDDGDRRHHARTIILSFPVLISLTGLVEAPAKPREYYLLRQQYRSLGVGDAAEVELLPKLKDKCIDHGDDRLTEVAKGYAMQAVFFHRTGDAFCENPGCRLYNAHWQADMLQAQLSPGTEFCTRHDEVLKDWAGERP